MKRHSVGKAKKHAVAVRWKRYPGVPGIQAPLSGWDDYVIAHRRDSHDVSYRPKGHHVAVGTFGTEAEAKSAAREHAKLSREKRLDNDSSWGALVKKYEETTRMWGGKRKREVPK
jgi:hypothetical protein